MDFNSIPLFQAVKKRLSWLGQRQEVLSQNISNADTPKYKAHDLKAYDFRDLVRRESTQIDMAVTQPNQMPGQRKRIRDFSDSTPLAWKYSDVVFASRGGQALNVRHVLLPLSNTVASAGTYSPVPFRYLAKNGASIVARYSTPVAAPKSILPSVRPSRRHPAGQRPGPSRTCSANVRRRCGARARSPAAR